MCKCYYGRHYYSHLSANILCIRCAQRYQKSQVSFETLMPANLTSLQNTFTLIENVSVKGIVSMHRMIEKRVKKFQI